MRLDGITEIQLGYTHRGALDFAPSGGLRGIRLRDIASDGEISARDLGRYSLGEISGRYMVREGDVLFRSRGERTTATALDRRFAEPAVALSPLMILRPHRNVILPQYLAWAINQAPAQRHFEQDAQGTSLRMVPKSSLGALEIDVPDLKTQQAVVAIDALAEQERALSERLVETRRLMMRKILLDCARNASAGEKGTNPR
ncbi:restriction endonuclease subunit S [bacterium SCSIO 12827]|nr:restriction endonuclease subunit S [bacterium SCSIO 12827]